MSKNNVQDLPLDTRLPKRSSWMSYQVHNHPFLPAEFVLALMPADHSVSKRLWEKEAALTRRALALLRLLHGGSQSSNRMLAVDVRQQL